jgi:hypothetical protein
VLTSTIPVTLTSRLPGGAHLDADAGLVYDGAGRFYDAALGLYLQPDPFGAAPEAPESLNRYAAPGVSTFPTVGSVPDSGHGHAGLIVQYAGLIATLSEIQNALDLNSAKAGLGLVVADKLAPRLLKASLVERLVEETVLSRVPKHMRLEKMIDVGLGATGVLRNVVGDRAPVRASNRFFSWLYGLNTSWVEETVLVPKMVPSDARLRRLAGWLAKDQWGQEALGFGVGLIIDVGVQGISDLGMLWRGELTWGQYGKRLGVEAVGSGLGWTAGFIAVSLLGLSNPVGIAVAIIASTAFDLLVKPSIYDRAGLNPRR